jgi:hypothetical protein
VLVTLAEREASGAVTHTRFAIRKQRDGIAGLEIPFATKPMQLGLR